MLLELSRRIRETDLDEMKHLCSDHIPVGRQENIQNALQLFHELEEIGELDEEKLDVLKNILYSRKDLVRIVASFQQGSWLNGGGEVALRLQRGRRDVILVINLN